MDIRRTLATVGATGALVTGSMLVASPAQAQPIITGGLVNVTIVDLLDIDDVTVQLPIAVAANVCDVNVAVLVADFADDGDANCTARGESRARA